MAGRMTDGTLHRTCAAGDAEDADPRRRQVFNILATETGVRAGLAEIRDFLDGGTVDADSCGTAEIVLAEALNNIAEHAYATTQIGKIRVTVTEGKRALAATIVDKGVALPGLCPPAGQLPPLGGSANSLPEGGFGWYLIRTLTDRLRYTRRAGENHLYLRIDYPAAVTARTRSAG